MPSLAQGGHNVAGGVEQRENPWPSGPGIPERTPSSGHPENMQTQTDVSPRSPPLPRWFRDPTTFPVGLGIIRHYL